RRRCKPGAAARSDRNFRDRPVAPPHGRSHRMLNEWTRGEYTISTDRSRLDLDVIHRFLVRSYWAEGRSRERVAQAIEQSLPWALDHGGAESGFARGVTD